MTIWQPIETAPKDGTEFIAFCESKKRKWQVAHWWENTNVPPSGKVYSHGRWEGASCQAIKPLAWMPLPMEPEIVVTIKKEVEIK